MNNRLFMVRFHRPEVRCACGCRIPAVLHHGAGFYCLGCRAYLSGEGNLELDDGTRVTILQDAPAPVD